MPAVLPRENRVLIEKNLLAAVCECSCTPWRRAVGACFCLSDGPLVLSHVCLCGKLQWWLETPHVVPVDDTLDVSCYFRDLITI